MQPQAENDLVLEGLVHDLNNVFQTIGEAADLLALDSRWAALAATIHRSVERGRRIVGGLSDSTRVSAEFEAVLDGAIEFTRDYLAAVHGPELSFRRELEPDLRLRGMPVAWERVLVNLFINAAQAMCTAGAVDVRGRRVQDFVEIIVADDGPGIPPEVLPQIFKPHFSTKTSPGLGLHIVESIVREHGGQVRAANREGVRGAEFSITAPAA